MTRLTKKFQAGEVAILCLLTCLFIYTLYLSVARIYQVDEAQNVFMAKVMATGQFHRYYTNGSLFLLGPMSWIARSSSTAAGMFTGARLLFLGVYWLNLVLLTAACGIRLRSGLGLPVMLAAATLAPMLDYGLEIRHDNVLLTLLLLFWVVVRRFRGPGWQQLLVLGIISGLMQFVAFKAFLYWIPLSLGVLLFPPPHTSGRRIQRLFGWSGGALLSFLIGRLAYGITGTWASFLIGFRTALGHSGDPGRFAPWETLGRLLEPIPLVLALMTAVIVILIQRWRKTGLGSLTWEGEDPEFLVLVLATFAFLANPVPYAYNLLLLVPFMFILLIKALDFRRSLFIPLEMQNRTYLLVFVPVLLFCHILPFAKSAWRHLDYSNDRQQLLMKTVESMTDPNRDCVFDATGLLPTREGVGYQWFLHTLVMEKFRDGKLPPLRDTLKATTPVAIIRSYRTDWLFPEDVKFIAEHYLLATDDLLVLGRVLAGRENLYECLHGGRYCIQSMDKAQAQGSRALVSIDGTPLDPTGIVFLQSGFHKIANPSEAKLAVMWLGPSLTVFPTLPNRDHRLLFVNWY